MNDQDEILVRQSKWNGRRVVLLYWFALVFMGTAVTIGLGTGVLNPKYTFKVEQYTHDDKFGDGTIWHPEDCATCHPAEYEGWNQTLHSYLFVEYNETHLQHYSQVWGDYNFTKAYFEDEGYSCCHFTNWYNTTQPDGPLDGAYWDYGVACAACHEDPDNGFDPVGYMPFGPGSYPCGGYGMKGMPLCHIPRGVSQFDWVKSPMYGALDDLLASDDIDDSCLHCMTGNGLIYDVGENNSYEYGELFTIECYVCHDPHGVSNELYKEDKYPNLMLNSSLRANSIPELCGECHSGEYGPAYEMITNTAVESPHSNFDCTQCHGYTLDPADESSDASFDLNHTWVLKLPDACASCHLPSGTNMSELNETIMATAMEGRMDTLEDIQSDIASLVTTVETKITTVTTIADTAAAVSGADQDEIDEIYLLIEEAEAMVAFVKADPSGGFHNYELAESKLQLALTKLAWAEAAANAIITPPETTEETSETTAETSETTAAATAVGIITILSILGVTVLFRKKKR
ncbi:MAG: multiheme c-type cytochrome [Promethearchaeota archaeon]